MASIFTKIVNGEIPCYKVAESDNYLAFLDVSPLAKGHTLVIPKRETDYIFNLEKNEYLGLWDFARKVAPAIEKAIPCKRIGITVIGLEVPHTHIHLIPLNSVADINFERPKLKFSNEIMAETSNAINKAFDQLQ